MAVNESFANSLVVEVEGTPLPIELTTLLSYAYVDDSRNLPDLFVLRFRDPGGTVLSKGGFKVGAKVVLKVQTSDPGGPQPLTSGEVTALGLDLDTTGTFTEVRGYDLAHRLFRGRRVAVYPNMPVADVVRKVAERAGLKVGTVDDVKGVGGRQHTQISQDNVSDWEFLSRLADLVGAQVAVVDGALDFRLPVKPAAPDAGAKATTDPLVLEAHRTLVALRATVTSAEQVPEVEVRGWDFEQKQAVSATAVPGPAGMDVPGLDPVAMAKTFGSPPYLAADGSYRSQAEAKATADALAARLGGACAELAGVAKGNPKLRAGVGVRLANVGDPFTGKYTLTSTRHLFSAEAGYTTEFTVSGRQERSLYGLVTGRQPARQAGGGLAPAVVSDVKDPAGLGRVKLTFPWLSKDYTSGWARVMQAGAGKDRGTLILPEVGDEVLAGFTGGDLDAPFVLGGLHNGKDRAPKLSVAAVDGTSGEIAARGFVSRTGHRVELVEKTGIVIATGDGKFTVKLDQQHSKVEIESGGTVSVTAKNGITVDAGSGELLLKGQKVKVTSTADLAVQAGSALSLQGTSGATVEGPTVTVKGKAQAELSADATVAVRGAMVRIN